MQARVSVIFPVFQRPEYLREAIESILRQTLQDFELIVIDDGSGPDAAQLLDTYEDPRIRLIRFPVNLGVSAARNAGLKYARAPFVALMDSDDVAQPERLAIQFDWLDGHPDLTVCGSHAIKFFPDGRRQPMRYPETDAIIKANLLLVDSAILNGTVMFRTAFAREHKLLYDSNFNVDEDHMFFVSMMLAGATFGTLSVPLLHYRRHAENVTFDETVQDDGKTAVRARLLPEFFPSLTGDEGKLLLKAMRRKVETTVRESCGAVAAFDKAMQESRSFYGEDRAHINRILERQVGTLMAAIKRANRVGATV